MHVVSHLHTVHTQLTSIPCLRQIHSIPLNDEFLTAFGRREKDYDNLAGREIDIDKTSLDAIDGLDSDDEVGREGKTGKKRNFGEMSNCKVSDSSTCMGDSFVLHHYSQLNI